MAGNGSLGAKTPYIRDPWGIDRYSVPAAGTGLRQPGILGSIDGVSGGLIPLPPIAGPQAVFRRPLTEVDLAPASASLMEKIGADLRAPFRWSPKDRTVIMSDAMMEKADAISRQFHDRTGKSLVVTSGSRTPEDQARAMFTKFGMGDTTTYTGPSGRQIRAIYDNGIAARKDKDAILKDMAATIQEQHVNGRPVSSHLDKRALDFSIQGMTRPETDFLQEVIRRHEGKPLHEGKPAHLHGSFPRR